ncbi:hypothetical protein COO60DRAFT_77509 [Scenedesmus sp. NREL 46B-D3]|nr:hypothetical protein COO60DRAFT_77509 [Scenedesmus sp. NREL 46B-D3]
MQRAFVCQCIIAARCVTGHVSDACCTLTACNGAGTYGCGAALPLWLSVSGCYLAAVTSLLQNICLHIFHIHLGMSFGL